MIILGIETSCDETAAALIKGDGERVVVLSNIVSSQVELHAPWGGVVPNLAAREHLKNILPVISQTIREANMKPQDIDLITVTAGPGLIPALLIGVNTAKTLAYVWKKPLMGIHHIEGHIYANFVSGGGSASTMEAEPPVNKDEEIGFPLLCLVVSGGHTQLILIKKHLNYEIIGQTLDDAAGEAFDKVARILGLKYPGGPEIAKMAAVWTSDVQTYQKNKEGHPMSILLPRPMIKSRDFNFSFSGLKTSVLYTTKKQKEFLEDPRFVSEMAHEFQQAVIDVLVFKTIKAARKYNPQTIILAGGVSANKELREQMGKAIEKNLPAIRYRIPDIKYSADNATMIAAAGYFRYQREKNKEKLFDNWKNLEADANLKL
jgi:N6-L-threonylcarbamoyladenine synthase